MTQFLLSALAALLLIVAVVMFCSRWYPTPEATTGEVTIYVSQHGADWLWRDGRSPETAVKTIRAAMQRAPKRLAHKITIQGDYIEGQVRPRSGR